MMRFRLLTSPVIIGGALIIATLPINAQGIGVTPQALSFVYQIGGAAPPAQNLYLSAGAPTQFSVNTSGAPWLAVAPASGMTPITLVATVRPPADATPGTLEGSIIIGPVASVDAVRLVVPVILQIVGPPQGNLVVSPTSLFSDYRMGGAPPMLMPVAVTSTGSPAAFRLTTDTTAGGSWLGVSASAYVTPATVFATIVPTAGLYPGTFIGHINVIPSYAGGVTQVVTVTLRVSSGGVLNVSPEYLHFEYQIGAATPPAQYLRVVDSVGAATKVSVIASTTSGGGWLSYSPMSGTTPLSVSVAAMPIGLSAGTYYGTITITPAGSVTNSQIPVTLTITNGVQLQVTPQTVTVDYQMGGTAPPPQYLYVTSTGAPVNFTPSVSGPSWITVPHNSVYTPAGVLVNVAPPAGTQPGTYTAMVTMTPMAGPATPVAAQVTVQVTGANYLAVSRSAVSFVWAPGSPAPMQVVDVTSSYGSIRYQATTSSSWLSVFQASQYTPSDISISAAPKALSPGTYNGVVTVFSDQVSNSPVTIDVTLTVAANPVLAAAPFGLMFSYQLGGPAPAPKLAVISTQGEPEAFSFSGETANGGKWLMVAGGSSTPTSIVAAIDTAPITTPGTYNGTIIVTPKSSNVPPLQIPVILSVTAGPNLTVNVGSVAFQYQVGGSAAVPQKVTIGTTSGSVGFYPSVRTSDGADWLTVTPDFATAPADITVAVDPSGLAPGYYLGIVALTGMSQDELTFYIPVTLQVSSDSILTVPAQSLIFRADVGGPTTAAQTVVVRSTPPAQIRVSTPGTPWVTVDPTSALGSANLAVSAIPDGMGGGYYVGVLVIDIPGVANSQQYVPVGLALRNPMVALGRRDR